MQRIYEPLLQEHFQNNKQMAFVCGPRQVGKTTLAQALARAVQKNQAGALYRSWDFPQDRVRIAGLSLEAALEGLILSPATHPLFILDEIHKFTDWKNYLKGLYDLYQGQMDILVTGSARLNIYRKGGDSLMGRYFLYRVHPITLGEGGARPLTLFQAPQIIGQDTLTHLLNFGGFPEPWGKGSGRFVNQWRHLRQQQLIYEDIRSLEAIQNLSQLELLATLLRYQAGQLVNYTNLASKVRVTVPTIQRWISVLEQVYYCYIITPWSQNISRSLLKDPKIYLWDWSAITDSGARYENLVASHLLKAVHFWTDSGLGVFGLHYIRTKDQKEVDFLVVKEGQPWMLVEVKASAKASLSKSLHEYKETLQCPFAFQLVFDLPSNQKSMDWISHNILEQGKAPAAIMPASSILSLLV